MLDGPPVKHLGRQRAPLDERGDESRFHRTGADQRPDRSEPIWSRTAPGGFGLILNGEMSEWLKEPAFGSARP